MNQFQHEYWDELLILSVRRRISVCPYAQVTA
jgi:hypothetical protein